MLFLVQECRAIFGHNFTPPVSSVTGMLRVFHLWPCLSPPYPKTASDTTNLCNRQSQALTLYSVRVTHDLIWDCTVVLGDHMNMKYRSIFNYSPT
jgi:hypothetical protein